MQSRYDSVRDIVRNILSYFKDFLLKFSFAFKAELKLHLFMSFISSCFVWALAAKNVFSLRGQFLRKKLPSNCFHVVIVDFKREKFKVKATKGKTDASLIQKNEKLRKNDIIQVDYAFSPHLNLCTNLS